METGLQNLYRDGLVAGSAPYPLRTDEKPRAVWPEGLAHLSAEPLVLEGEEEEAPFVDSVRESADKDRYYHRRYGDEL